MEHNKYLTGLNRETCSSVPAISTIKNQNFAHACEDGFNSRDFGTGWVGGDSPLDLQFAHPSRSAVLQTGF
jgi:hypothetical protein